MTESQHIESKPAVDPTGAPKILRIGILQGGKLVEERLVRKRETVTIGQSAKNTFVVPTTVLSRSFPLFEMTSQGYALNFTEGMDGRIAFDQATAPLTLAQIRQKAQKRGEIFHVLVPERSRGKIVIGDVTVLYQFVVPPPVQPRPQLPPSVRGSVTQDLDWLMLGIVTVSLVAHLGFVVYLRQVDWPRKPDIEDIPDRFVQMIVPKKKEEPKKTKVDPNANRAADKAKDDARKKAAAEEREAAKAAAGRKGDPEAEARAAAERRAKLAAEVQKMGVLKLLGAKGGGEGSSTVADLLRSGDPGGNADSVFAHVGGVATAGAGGAGTGGGIAAKGAGGTGTVKGIAGLRGGGGPGEVATGEKGGEKVPRGSLKDVRGVEVEGGTLSTELVISTIKSRKSAVIACYERALKRNPGLQGKVVLRFTISAVGKVTSTEIEDDSMGDSEVTRCMQSTVSSWRFPAPSGGEVSFSYPFVFQSSG